MNEYTTVISKRNGMEETRDSFSNIWLHTTLQLETGDEITIWLQGDLYDLNDDFSTFFEGRLISKFDE